MKLHFTFGQPPEGNDVLWRVEAKRYSYTIDADTDSYGITAPRLEACWWAVERRTPKGAWLKVGGFILLTARKRWACNTVEEALESFRARKRRQIKILSGQLRNAETDLALATEEEKV